MFGDVQAMRGFMLLIVGFGLISLFYAATGSGFFALVYLIIATLCVLFTSVLVWPNMCEEDRAAVTPHAGRVSDKEYS